MRQITGSFLLASAAAMIAVPLAEAAEKVIQLTDQEKREIGKANDQLLSMAFRFLHDSWPLDIMSPGDNQEEFHSILQCYRMLDQFRQTGNLLLRAPDRNTPLHLCIALGLNKLAIRMVEAGAPVNVQAIALRDGLQETGDTPLTWACAAGIYRNTPAEERLPLVQALLRHGADPDLPGPAGITPFIWSAALNDSDPGQSKLALAILDAGSPDIKRRLDARARYAAFLSLSPALYERMIRAGCDVNERFFESKQTPLHLVCTKEKPAEQLIPLIKLLIQAGADPNQADVDGLTPLMVCNSPEIAVCLMDHGANPALRNEDGQTAYDFHLKNGYPDIAETIKKWQDAAQQQLPSNGRGR